MVVVVDQDAQVAFVEMDVFAEGTRLANQVVVALTQGGSWLDPNDESVDGGTLRRLAAFEAVLKPHVPFGS